MRMKRVKSLYFDESEFVVAIIHYNTPELTHAAIGSLIYNGGVENRLRIVVFDNSDSQPFGDASGVIVIDNTQGQIIDFDKELEKFPHRDRSIGCAKGCEFGSAKHMMTVQKLWDILPGGFVLMESDILIRKSIAEFWAPEFSVYGYWQKVQPGNPFTIGRMLPMLCYMNVPMLTREGARYFDPARTYGLLEGGRDNRYNWYDTGAVLLEDIINAAPRLEGRHVDIRPYVAHYGSASWKENDADAHCRWIEANRYIFPSDAQITETTERFYKHIEDTRQSNGVAICAIGRKENRYAVEWVEHYKALGVEKIYIYDNNHPEDGELFCDVLQPYIDEGLVKIVYWQNNQKSAYEHCYNTNQRDFTWMGFFDFDELVEIPSGRSIPDLLSGFEFADVLVMNWRTMTDNGLTHYEDLPMKERFTEGTGEDFPINRHVKSFVQTGVNGISFNDPHCPCAPKLMVVNVHGTRVEQMPLQPTVIHDIARIDHYDTKSTEEWMLKVNRGWCDVNATLMKQRQDKSAQYYFGINKWTLEKAKMLGVEIKQEPPTFDEPQAGLKFEPTPSMSSSKPKTKNRTNKKQK